MYNWDKHFKEFGEKGTERKDSDDVERAAITKIITTVIETYGKPIFRGGTVLDFGCGRGRFVNMFESAGCEYYGFDIVKSNIDYCCEKYKSPPPVFSLVKQSKPYLNVFNINIIFTSTVLQHIHDLSIIEKEFKRVLTKDGSLILFENTSEGLPDSEFITFRTFEEYEGIFDFVDLKRKIDIIDIAGEKHTLMIGRKI